MCSGGGGGEEKESAEKMHGEKNQSKRKKHVLKKSYIISCQQQPDASELLPIASRKRETPSKNEIGLTSTPVLKVSIQYVVCRFWSSCFLSENVWGHPIILMSVLERSAGVRGTGLWSPGSPHPMTGRAGENRPQGLKYKGEIRNPRLHYVFFSDNLIRRVL